MVEHLTDLDVTRVLAFDEGDDDAHALAEHAAACAECTARLANGARLELLLVDCAEARPRAPIDPPSLSPSRLRRSAPALIGAFALAAAGLLALRSQEEREHREPITSAAIDLASSAGSPSPSVDRWALGGTSADRFTRVTERDPARPDLVVRGLLRADGPAAQGLGTLLQVFAATRFTGKRIRFSADVQTASVEHHAFLWVRADGLAKQLALDSMGNRPIRGTTPWTRYAIVLDVPADATRIIAGIGLEGSGRAVFTDARFEIVGTEVPVTLPPQPTPLAPDFAP